MLSTPEPRAATCAERLHDSLIADEGMVGMSVPTDAFDAKFCHSCGSPIEPLARFCGRCGAPVAAAPPAQPPTVPTPGADYPPPPLASTPFPLPDPPPGYLASPPSAPNAPPVYPNASSRWDATTPPPPATSPHYATATPPLTDTSSGYATATPPVTNTAPGHTDTTAGFTGAHQGSATAPTGPRPGGQRPRWVIPVAALALVVIGAIVFMLMRPDASATPQPSSPVSSEPSAEPQPSDVMSPSPEAAGFSCWNGMTADVVDDCGTPTGIEGLKYIYPSLVTQWDRCKYADYRPTTATYDCTFAEGVIRYRYWKDAAEARRHYTAKYAKADKTELVLDGEVVGTLYRATKRDKKGLYTMTAWWGGGHYSLSVEARDRAAQEKLWNTVTFRAFDDLSGHPSGAEPREARRS